jgi:hypothetical protein
VWREAGALDYGVGCGVSMGAKVEVGEGHGDADRDGDLPLATSTDSPMGLEAVPLQRVSSHQPRPVAATAPISSSGMTIAHTGVGSRIMPKSVSMNGMADLKVRIMPLSPPLSPLYHPSDTPLTPLYHPLITLQGHKDAAKDKDISTPRMMRRVASMQFEARQSLADRGSHTSSHVSLGLDKRIINHWIVRLSKVCTVTQ